MIISLKPHTQELFFCTTELNTMSYTFVVCWDDEGRTPNKELVRNDVQELVAFLDKMGKHKAWKGFYRKLFTTNRLSAAMEAIKKSEGTWVILLFTKQFMAGKKVKDAEDLCACIQHNNKTIPLYYEGDREDFKAACKSGLLNTIGLTPRVAHCIENNKEWMNKVYESLKKGIYDNGKSKGTSKFIFKNNYLSYTIILFFDCIRAMWDCSRRFYSTFTSTSE